MKLVENGTFKGVVAREFPLQDAGDAHRLMESRDFYGKIVLVP